MKPISVLPIRSMSFDENRDKMPYIRKLRTMPDAEFKSITASLPRDLQAQAWNVRLGESVHSMIGYHVKV